MIVISNTSPIANLAAIGQLDLLHKLYGSVIIPQAVFAEVAAAGELVPQAIDATTHGWIETRLVANQSLVASLKLELDDGEAEAIALAHEQQASLLLIDERKGRSVASRLGLRFIGLLGALIEAKHKGILPAVKPLMEALTSTAGFWISQELRERVLLVADEQLPTRR